MRCCGNVVLPRMGVTFGAAFQGTHLSVPLFIAWWRRLATSQAAGPLLPAAGPRAHGRVGAGVTLSLGWGDTEAVSKASSV